MECKVRPARAQPFSFASSNLLILTYYRNEYLQELEHVARDRPDSNSFGESF